MARMSRSAAPFPGLHSPAAGFDQPFEMLSACHERVRRSLALLQRLVAHVEVHGADRQARDAAADVLRYFTQAAPAHHEDEERHVIPRLQASDDPRAQAAAQQLLEDHEAIRVRWAALAPLLQSLAGGALPKQERLHAAAQAFVDVHEDHLRLEDEYAFPRTEAQLRTQGDEALRAMGQEMAARRGPPSG
jgi:hemerythrin-like domain-containing protein